jgi:hypothetical protein
MGRPGVSKAAKQAAALQASRRMIVRGDRPAYRITTTQDGRWLVDALPWVSLTASERHEALEEARAAIAEWLGGRPDAFDVAT